MHIDSIKRVNTTFLFPNPINHSLIQKNDVLDVIQKEGGANNANNNVIQAPHFLGVFLDNGIEVIFEQQRMLVNDKSSSKPSSSPIVDYAYGLLQKQFLNELEVSSYGFNYDLVAELEKLEVIDLIGDSITSLPFELQSGGINIKFEHKDLEYNLQTKPATKDENKIIIHFNPHVSKLGLPEKENVKKEFERQFIFLKDEVLSNLNS